MGKADQLGGGRGIVRIGTRIRVRGFACKSVGGPCSAFGSQCLSSTLQPNPHLLRCPSRYTYVYTNYICVCVSVRYIFSAFVIL